MGLFGNDKIECECCKKEVEDVKEVCENCFSKFIASLDLETQVRLKMEDKDRKELDEQEKKEEFDSEGYVEIKETHNKAEKEVNQNDKS